MYIVLHYSPAGELVSLLVTITGLMECWGRSGEDSGSWPADVGAIINMVIIAG